MTRSRLFLLLILPFLTLDLMAGLGDTTEIFPKGKVYAKIFSNFHAGLNESSNSSGFEISRAYFGYKAELGQGFGANVKLDIGSPEDLSQYSLIRRYAYFKNAYVNYSNSKLKAYFGIIDLLHFKDQEEYWAHRYIEKVFADNYRFGNSADLGTQVIYKWNDWLSSDITFMNGEGYTRLQADNTYKTGAGITFNPAKILRLRIYGDVSVKNDVTQSALVFFAGTKIRDEAMLGVEYNLELNSDYHKDKQRYGYSMFASWFVTEKWQVFGRYDKLMSNKMEGEDNPWNLSKDGSAVIGGIEFSPHKSIKIALNYQDWFPWADKEPNDQYIYLNMEVVF